MHDTKTYQQLQSTIKKIKQTKDQLDDAVKEYNDLVNSSPLLIEYSKYLTRIYRAMTILCKLTNEPLYSWKMYITIISEIIKKVLRDRKNQIR